MVIETKYHNTGKRLKVFDNIGREVTTLVNQNMEAGEYEAVFDGSNLASGCIFLQN